METENIKDLPMSPWVPMKKPIDLKHLGKLLEELGECSSAVARCLIQGIEAVEPTTGKLNRLWLEDEIADVFASATLVMEHFDLSCELIEYRTHQKRTKLQQWHKLLE